MKSCLSPKHHLGVRLLIALAAMLLPLLFLGASTHFSFQLLTASLGAVAEEGAAEMPALTQTQQFLQEARIVLQQAVYEGDSSSQRRFAELMTATDEAFAAGQALPFSHPERKRKFEAAWQLWRQARQGVADHAEVPTAEGDGFRTFDIHASQAAELLRQAHQLAEMQVVEQLRSVDATKGRISRLNASLFAIGVGMVLGIGFFLCRSILRPIRQLESGVRRLAGGDFSYRFAATREDELGELARAFDMMAQQLAQDRQSLQELSVRDPLTGLYNHREFFRLLDEELARARRYRHPLSVLMLDLDFFKKVNDTYGHQAGDQTLTTVSELISRELRRVDEIARYGGEEFAVILPETPGAEALALADRIRHAVAARPLAISGTDGIRLTVSIGLAVYPDDADTVDWLVEKADKALYRAKQEGRNRVCAARPAAVTPASGIAAGSFIP